MNFFRSMAAAFAMFSKFPAPKVEWTKDTLAWAMCHFPLVGVGIGAVLYGWLYLCSMLELRAQLAAAGALILPIILSGAIHMDGFCDTADALASNLERERKLEILKDVHTGAFAVICCSLYLIFFYAVWCEMAQRVNLGETWHTRISTISNTVTRELSDSVRVTAVLCLTPVLSRACSGLAAVSLPNARGSGLLSTFTEPMNQKAARVILGLWVLMTAGVMIIISPKVGVCTVFAAAAVSVYYIVVTKREFGGITGDLEGWYLQINETVMVLAAVVGVSI